MADAAQAHRVAQMMMMDGNSTSIVVTNSYGQAVNSGGRTISKEGWDELHLGVLTWIGTRIQRALDAGLPASTVEVEVTVKCRK